MKVLLTLRRWQWARFMINTVEMCPQHTGKLKINNVYIITMKIPNIIIMLSTVSITVI